MLPRGERLVTGLLVTAEQDMQFLGGLIDADSDGECNRRRFRLNASRRHHNNARLVQHIHYVIGGGSIIEMQRARGN